MKVYVLCETENGVEFPVIGFTDKGHAQAVQQSCKEEGEALEIREKVLHVDCGLACIDGYTVSVE